MTFCLVDDAGIATLAKTLGKDICETKKRIENEYLRIRRDYDGYSIYAALFSGCIVFRLAYGDGEYFFTPPVPVCDGADIGYAVELVADYATGEEIPLIFDSVFREHLGLFFGRFRHINSDATSPFSDEYRLRILSEGNLLYVLPELCFEDIAFNSLGENDKDGYERLCSDPVTNKYWGYDPALDIAEGEQVKPVDMTLFEFDRGTIIPFAVRVDGAFAGELVFHAFDFRGGCEVGLRLLPEYRGRGIGKRVISFLPELALEVGLCRVYATVLKENKASVKVFSEYFDKRDEEKEKIRFIFELYEEDN